MTDAISTSVSASGTESVRDQLQTAYQLTERIVNNDCALAFLIALMEDSDVPALVQKNEPGLELLLKLIHKEYYAASEPLRQIMFDLTYEKHPKKRLTAEEVAS